MFSGLFRRKKSIRCKTFYDYQTRTIDFGAEGGTELVKVAITKLHISKEKADGVNKLFQALDEHLYRKCLDLNTLGEWVNEQEFKRECKDYLKQKGKVEDCIFKIRVGESTYKENKVKEAKKMISKALNDLNHCLLVFVEAEEESEESRKKGICEEISPYARIELSEQERKEHENRIHKSREYGGKVMENEQESLLTTQQLLQFASTLFYTDSYTKSLEIYDKILAEDSKHFISLVNSGYVLFHLGKLAESEERLSKARHLYKSFDRNQKQKFRGSFGICLQWLGILRRSRGYNEEAKDLHNEALKIAREINNGQLEAHAIANLGAILLWESQFNPSEINKYWTQSLEISQRIRDIYWEVHYGIDVGYMTFLEGKYHPKEKRKNIYKEALKMLKKYTEIAGNKEYKEHIARGFFNQGNVYFALEKLDDALKNYEKALQQAKQLQTARLIWRIAHNMANIYRKQKEFEKAEEGYQEAIDFIKNQIKDKTETEIRRFLSEKRRDAFHSRLFLELDRNNKNEAIRLAKEYKEKFYIDLLDNTEEKLDMNKLRIDSPNFINEYYVLTE